METSAISIVYVGIMLVNMPVMTPIVNLATYNGITPVVCVFIIQPAIPGIQNVISVNFLPNSSAIIPPGTAPNNDPKGVNAATQLASWCLIENDGSVRLFSSIKNFMAGDVQATLVPICTAPMDTEKKN